MSRFAIVVIAAVLALCGPRVAIAGDDDALHLADMRALAVREAAEWRAKADAGDKVRDARMMIDAADAGHVAAQAIVGTDYVKARDYPNAFRYLGPAAEKGHPKAQAGLGLMYEQGRGGLKPDRSMALDLYRRAAAGGERFAIDRQKKLEGGAAK